MKLVFFHAFQQGWRNLVTYALFFWCLCTTGMKSVSGVCKGRRVQGDFLFLLARGSVSGVATRNFDVCSFSATLNPSSTVLHQWPSTQASLGAPVPSFLATCSQGLGLFVPLGCLTDGFSGWFELVWVVTHFFCRHNCFPSCRLKPFLCLILSMSLNGP